MAEDLKTYIMNFIEARTEEVSSDLHRGKEYIELWERLRGLQNDIMKHLPEESEYIFLDYEDCENKLDDLVRNTIYTQGLVDGMRLGKIMSRIGK
ncbi:MAG TPA: hypothetical protein PK566_18545 [Pseudobacteroides sp.]|nr:hypothetical protein [Pseudobacteroides sp.]